MWRRKPLLQLGNFLRTQPESLLQELVFDPRSKNRIWNPHQPGILTVETPQYGGWSVSHIHLKVHHSFRKHHHLAFLDNLCEDLVARVDEARVDLPFEHERHLGRSWMEVRHIDPANFEISSHEGHPERVEPREDVGVD